MDFDKIGDDAHKETGIPASQPGRTVTRVPSSRPKVVTRSPVARSAPRPEGSVVLKKTHNEERRLAWQARKIRKHRPKIATPPGPNMKKGVRPKTVGVDIPATRRLIRRAGGKRIHHGVYPKTRRYLRGFLHDTIKNAVALMQMNDTVDENGKVKEACRTLMLRHIEHALATNGHPLYGMSHR